MKKEEKAQARCCPKGHGYLREDLRTIVEFFEGHALWSQVWGLVLFALTVPLAFVVPVVAGLVSLDFMAIVQPYMILVSWFVILACLLSTQQDKGYPYNPSKLVRLFDDVVVFLIQILLQLPGYVLWALSLVVAVSLIPIMLLLDTMFKPSCPSKA